jgi:outer membrane protein TolC
MPWGFRAERAGLRQAELRRLQGDLDLADVDIALLRDIRIGCRAVATGVARIGSTRVTRSLQEEQFAQERARYEAGLVTIRDTLIAQDNLNEARLRVLVAMRDTIEALIRLARLEGSLLEAHGIAWKTPDEEE